MSVLEKQISDVMLSSGYRKKLNHYYRKTTDSVLVLNLQKSSFGADYYINIAVFPKILNPPDFPKVHQCPLYMRIDDLPGVSASVGVLEGLSSDSKMSAPDKSKELLDALVKIVIPFLENCSSIDGLKKVLKHDFMASAMLSANLRDLLS